MSNIFVNMEKNCKEDFVINNSDIVMEHRFSTRVSCIALLAHSRRKD